MSSVADCVAGARELALYGLLRQRLVLPKLVTAPAAGTEWTLTVPPGTLWELLSVREQLVTSAVVANRTASIRVADADANTVGRFPPAAVQAASLTQAYSWYAGLGAVANVGEQNAPLPSPPLTLLGGWSVRSVTTNIDAGDQLSLVVAVVREWALADIRLQLQWIEERGDR